MGGVIATLSVYIYLHTDGVFCQLYEQYVKDPLLSFPGALLWLMLGCVISDKVIDNKIDKLGQFLPCTFLIISFACGCYFREIEPYTRIIGVIAIFAIAKNWKLKDNPMLYARLRIYSIHFFCMHFSLFFVVSYFFKNHILLVFVLTLFVCWLISETMIRLMHVPPFYWLKYSK